MTFAEFVQSKNEITLGFLGGSITFGTGASSGNLCYRNRITAMLQEKYPNTEFKNINAAIGGTGSDLGLFHMEKQLLSEKPDIVFVEFAVNDGEDSKTDVYMENILRRVWKKDSSVPVVFLYSICDYMADKYYSQGKTPKVIEKQQKIADYYNIISVNMGKAVYEKMEAGNFDIKAYTTDGVHPNDKGHGIYAECVVNALEKMRIDYRCPEKFLTKEIKNPSLVIPRATGNWKESRFKTYGIDEPYIYSNTPGDSYEHTFTGTIVGVVFLMEKDCGIFRYSIDDGEEKTFSCYDHYCDRFPRTSYTILADSLTNGKHTIKITVSDSKEENSEGTYIRISAFLTAE